MNKKVLVISSSPRRNGNSDILCDEFIRGAQESGHHTEKLRLQEKNIKGCLGCEACKKNDLVCVHKDDMAEILEKMVQADVIALATPVYFYSMDGQIKTLIDRTYARYTEMKGKDFYFIIAGAAPETSYMDTTIACLRGFVVCVPDSHEKGIVYGVNAGEAGTVKSTSAMQESYQMGKSI